MAWVLDYLLEPCAPYWYDNSEWGKADWQWAPPGWSCTYVAEGSDAVVAVTHPTWGMVFFGLLLVAFPLIAARRSA